MVVLLHGWPYDIYSFIVIHNYRWRLGLAAARHATTRWSSGLPQVPSSPYKLFTLEGDANGVPHPDSSAYRGKFTGKYEHRLITGGVGHNLPREAPQAFAQAVVDVAGF